MIDKYNLEKQNIIESLLVSLEKRMTTLETRIMNLAYEVAKEKKAPFSAEEQILFMEQVVAPVMKKYDVKLGEDFNNIAVLMDLGQRGYEFFKYKRSNL
jgi:hypothetical protein